MSDMTDDEPVSAAVTDDELARLQKTADEAAKAFLKARRKVAAAKRAIKLATAKPVKCYVCLKATGTTYVGAEMPSALCSKCACRDCKVERCYLNGLCQNCGSKRTFTVLGLVAALQQFAATHGDLPIEFASTTRRTASYPIEVEPPTDPKRPVCTIYTGIDTY